MMTREALARNVGELSCAWYVITPGAQCIQRRLPNRICKAQKCSVGLRHKSIESKKYNGENDGRRHAYNGYSNPLYRGACSAEKPIQGNADHDGGNDNCGDRKHHMGHVYPFAQMVDRYLSPIGASDQ